MNLLQSLRRLGQQANGWSKSFEMLDHQLNLLTKLYSNNGLELKLTCGACPEQYEVFNSDGQQVAYLRLRHGGFKVNYPGVMGETIYRAEPNGDGTFDEDERLIYMTNAMRAILKKINE